MSEIVKQIDRYIVQAELGRGGAGVVYRAYDPEIRVSVAIKVVLGLDEKQRSRFRREARALANLSHPGVVKLLDVGEWHGRSYLVLEYVDGSSLQARIDRSGPLEQEEVVSIGLALADALEAVHAEGLLHRDLKPDNVLLDVKGNPFLTDFGLVKNQRPSEVSQQLTVSGAMHGTPGYWSPEQATGSLRRIGPATDVYGLGATLYGALTGGPPVDADTLRTLLLATARQEPTPPSKLRKGISPALDAVVLTCLRKDPDDRFRSAADVAAALRAARSVSPKRSQRHPLAAALAVALVLLLGLGVGAWALVRSDASDDAPPPPVTPPVPIGGPAAAELFERARAVEARKGPAEAVHDLRLAATSGHLGAMVRLAQILSQEESVPRDDEQAALWFQKAAEAGDPQAMSEWGFMLIEARGTQRDDRMGREWFRRSAKAGNPEGMSNLGYVLQEGTGGPPDPEAAIAWFRRAAEAKHPAALFQLGFALVEGRGVPAEPEEGMRLLGLASVAGHRGALFWLARYTRLGRGVPRDPVRALELYLRAAKEGSVRAKTTAAQMLITGDEVRKDLSRGEALLREAGDAGDAPALTILGQYLEAGSFGTRYPSEARRLYRQAAEANDPGGMFYLGRVVAQGIGGPQSVEEGTVWLRRAAEASFAPAMFALAQACESGVATGGASEARRWYSAAAESGHVPAQQALAALDPARTKREPVIVDFTLRLTEVLWSPDAPATPIVAIAGSDERCLVASDQDVSLWNVSTTKRLWRSHVERGGITAVQLWDEFAFLSSDGILETRSALDGSSKSISMPAPQLYLPDGRQIVLEEGAIDIMDRRSARSSRSHLRVVRNADRVFHGGETLLAVSETNVDWFSLVSPQSDDRSGQLRLSSPVISAGVSGNGQRVILLCSNGDVLSKDLSNGEAPRLLTTSRNAMGAVAGKGLFLIYGQELLLFDAATDALRGRLELLSDLAATAATFLSKELVLVGTKNGRVLHYRIE